MVAKGQRGDQRRRRRKIDYLFASYFTLQTDSSRCREDFWDANQIVCRCRQYKEPFHQAAPAMPGLAQATHRFHPPERLFNPLALDRADAIAGMTSRARVDRRAAVGVVLRDVRRAAAFATANDEVSRIIVLVATHGASRFGVVLDHVERGRALGRAIGLRQPGIDDKPIAVLHHQMPHVTELGLLAGTLAKQSSVGVGGRRMRVILAFLAMEVAFDIAPATAVLTFPRRRLAAVLRHETFHAGPGLDQRAVDREVLAREELAVSPNTA